MTRPTTTSMADTAASKLAVALGAKKLILLTDVRGLMLDVNDENSVLHRLKVSEVPKLVQRRRHQGRHDPEGGLLR